MRNFFKIFLAIFSILALENRSFGQKNSVQLSDSSQLSVAYVKDISTKAKSLQKKLEKRSLLALSRMHRQEAALEAKLAKQDSVAAQNLFSDVDDKYQKMEARLKATAGKSPYISNLDSTLTSLKFLQQNPGLLKSAVGSQEKVTDAINDVKGLQDRFGQADEVKQFIAERRQLLNQQLQNFGLAKQLKSINKEAYFYAEQIKQYKELLKDPDRAEKKALELLSHTKLFTDFFRNNSQLAALFNIPGATNSTSTASLAGLQTRAQVNNLIQQQLAASGPNAQQQFSQNMQQAQAQLSQLKSKLNQLGNSGSGSSDDIMPEGFTPNGQRTKSFLKRIELGINIQSQKANGYFPVTTTMGVSAGYKITDRSIAGVGISYKIGWGQNIQHVKITQQGLGLRSFVDWKVKGSWWLTGGFEMNHNNEFKSINQLKDLDGWQQSGLLGISKQVSLKTKFFKNTKLQLLWDFLSYQQSPQTQPILFRVAYSFK